MWAARLGRAANELDGAVFVDGFFVGSQRPATQEFVAVYEQTYQAAPQILEAQAYDAATLLHHALAAGARTRTQVVPVLQELRTLEGAAGTLGMGPIGVQRQLFILRLVGGRIAEITPERSKANRPAAAELPAVPVVGQ